MRITVFIVTSRCLIYDVKNDKYGRSLYQTKHKFLYLIRLQHPLYLLVFYSPHDKVLSLLYSNIKFKYYVYFTNVTWYLLNVLNKIIYKNNIILDINLNLGYYFVIFF